MAIIGRDAHGEYVDLIRPSNPVELTRARRAVDPESAARMVAQRLSGIAPVQRGRYAPLLAGLIKATDRGHADRAYAAYRAKVGR